MKVIWRWYQDANWFLFEWNPFKINNDLKSITLSGVVAHDSTADQEKQTYQNNFIVTKMADQKVDEFSVRNKDALVTMNDKSALKIGDDHVMITSQLLLLQRVVSAANRMIDEPDLPLAYVVRRFKKLY